MLLKKKAQFLSLSSVLLRSDSEMVPVFENLIDQVWDSKPAVSKNKVFVHELKYSGTFSPINIPGLSHEKKIEMIRTSLKNDGLDGTVVAALDEIAWLFNLRGNDVDFNPVFLSYAILTHDDVTLYINKEKLDETTLAHLGKTVKVSSYESVFDDLKKLASQNKVFDAFNLCLLTQNNRKCY